MNFRNLQIKSLNYPLFTYADILKWFAKDNEATIKQNLKYWIKKKWVERIARGLYTIKNSDIEDEFIISYFLDNSSYISLESALSIYSMIPEYPYAVTSATVKKTKTVKTSYGLFYFRKIKPELYFGFKTLKTNNYIYKMAEPEKALFDFIYLNQRQIKGYEYFTEMRLSIPKKFSWKKFSSMFIYLRNKSILEIIQKYAANK